ncbi:TraV family lipoprotein [Novosphingobium sp. B1]|uniref:TraV family lipoprotein n=1 Tax=Novosphingobium sp. B1 TaxID=1938756 RepID=UPI0009D8455B|nr:TraV family lipoprotein [Novosphingobium sp. B1]SMC30694.1 conjugal transfer pilus assembly protein TraV [Novosphingobium sp. B1]
MYRSIPLVFASLSLALGLAGCTHLGTNIAGDFSCRAQASRTHGAGCQPLSEVDAKAIRELIKAEGSDLAAVRQRVAVTAADTARTGERTLKVVFPAHVDTSGTLHDEAAVWTVVEAARWAGELSGGKVTEPKGTMRALRDALKDQARRAADASRKTDVDANANPAPLSPEDSDPAATNPFIPSSPLVLPSPGGEIQADAPPSAAGGSDMSPTPHGRAPRPLEEMKRAWPSAAAIEAAKALKRAADAAPKKEPK